jgi:N-sulfoglucosamine sulfohydrolase
MRTLALLLLAAGPVFADGPNRNVLLLIADDLGMQVGCYGDKTAKTPNIDTIAKAGTRFTNGFASVASCPPSRATISRHFPSAAHFLLSSMFRFRSVLSFFPPPR